MKFVYAAALAIAIGAGLAYAQPRPDHLGEATRATITEIMSGYVAMRAQVLAEQEKNTQLQARIAELEAKAKAAEAPK